MRSFKCYTNLSPHQYVIRTRIARSKELLTNTNRSLWDISYEVGFNNLSQFHRNFVTVVGCTLLLRKGSPGTTSTGPISKTSWLPPLFFFTSLSINGSMYSIILICSATTSS
ncbi:helix-turn-helix domain-containing protein [Fictibacillus halophilus]|uniref:helix-turn-helix domain-containing protein n=1 Tax=Fictibacillus halophilus TaxID=1610490 RepID=UPI0018E83EA8